MIIRYRERYNDPSMLQDPEQQTESAALPCSWLLCGVSFLRERHLTSSNPVKQPIELRAMIT